MPLPFRHPDLELLVERLRSTKNVLGVALFGSWARGTNRPDSDMDILVLVNTGVRRGVESLGKTNFEFVYVSPKEALSFYKANPDNAVRMWRDAKIIFDSKGELKRLKAFAQRLEKQGKKPLSIEKVRHAIFDATDALRAIRGLIKNDPATANLYAHLQAIHLLELAYDIKGLWKPAPKQQLTALADHNPKLAKLFSTFFTAWSMRRRLQTLEQIHQQLF